MASWNFSPESIQKQIEENREAAGLEIEPKDNDQPVQENQSAESFLDKCERESSFSTASEENLPYVVLQVTLKEKFIGTGSGNLDDLEKIINKQVAKGYRLHTMSTSNGGSKGFAGGDRIQATLIFERLDIYRNSFGK